MRISLFVPLAFVAAALPASAQTFGPAFAADYTFADLGTPAAVPGPLGGINFDPSDPNTIWVGGSANNAGGAIYAVPVQRDAQGHITAFSGMGTQVATAPNIDGGLTFGPTGVMFVTTYSNNHLLQFLPGSTTPDRDIDLNTFGISSSTGTCQFVPSGFAGAGTFKVGSYNSGNWYDVALVPDGSGTFDLGAVTATVQTPGGPEGLVYIASGNPGFVADGVLISEYSSGRVSAYDIDANGDPIVATRRDFLTGLSGAEGAVIDPVTGDFLFSTFGGGNRVIVVRGFSAPTIFCTGLVNSRGCTPTITYTGSPTATGPDDFVVRGEDVLNHNFGLLLASTTPGNTPLGNGVLCLSGTILRRAVTSSAGAATPPGSDCSGVFQDALTQAWFGQNALAAGSVVYVQYLSRDQGYAPPGNLSLSDGLRFTILP